MYPLGFLCKDEKASGLAMKLADLLIILKDHKILKNS